MDEASPFNFTESVQMLISSSITLTDIPRKNFLERAYLYLFREREGREKNGQRNIDVREKH